MRLKWTYHSNALKGSTLEGTTLEGTTLILRETQVVAEAVAEGLDQYLHWTDDA